MRRCRDEDQCRDEQRARDQQQQVYDPETRGSRGMDSVKEHDGRQRLPRKLLSPQQVSENRNRNGDEPGERPWQTKAHDSAIPQELEQGVLRRSVGPR